MASTRTASTRDRQARIAGIFSLMVIGTLVLAACAKSTTPGAGGSSSPPANAGAVSVSTTSVAGMGTVLVDEKGSALYTLKSEASGTISCTGTCAANWPPLLLPDGVTAATPGSGVKATDLGTIARPDSGTQVTYNGLPLYLFVGDQQPGQVTGDGVAGFSVATTSGPGPASPTSSSSSHYGY